MGKKNDKGLVKDNKSGVDDEQSKSPDLSIPHTCTGQFNIDFTELCRRLQPPPIYIPLVVPRPHRPTSPANLPVIDEKPVKVGKGNKKDEAKNLPVPEPAELETPLLTENGEIPEPPPKTYTMKDRIEYFRPCIQVEMENPDKYDTVIEVHIRGWKVDVPMMDVLKQCFASSAKLNTISLWSVGLTDDTLEMLSSLLQTLPTLRSLILDGNSVASEPWYLLFKDESPVQHLSLRYNGITDCGIEKISSALGSLSHQNQKLLSLNLAGNRISDQGALHLAKGLRFNRCLLSLTLNGNQIGDEGAKCLAEVVSRFELTHDEIVARRKLLSVNADRKSTRSASPSGRKERHERPGSVRSMTASSQNTSSSTLKGSKQQSKTKKADNKASKEEEAKHEKSKAKTKEQPEKPSKKELATRRPSAANVTADATKSVSKRPEKTRGKKSAQQVEPETVPRMTTEAADVGEAINPLLEPVETLANGTVLMKGNMTLINLNLANNRIGQCGAEAFLNAIKYQTTMSLLTTTKSNNHGLLRLSLQRNKISSDAETMKLLNALMATRDPMAKSSSSGRETELA